LCWIRRGNSNENREVVDVVKRLKIPITLIWPCEGVLSDIAFHEKAGSGQADFDLPCLTFSLSFMAEGVQSGPERSRERSLRRQRTLDGEDRSVTIPP